jgi:glycosyltransferase involved in cell wall biosynthesis
MTILFVNTASGWGGGEKWHFETALAMQAKTHQVAVMARPNEELFLKAVAFGLRTIPVQVTNLSFLNPFKICAIKNILKRETPDVVILNFSADLKTIGIAARCAGIKNIIYRRGNAKAIRNSLFNRFLFRKIVTGMIANSEETKKSVLKNNPDLFPAEKIKVIYNGIPLKTFDPMPSVPLYNREGINIVIGSAGRLSHEKGHHFLIEIAVLLRKDQVPFTILLAGKGPRELALKKAVAENQLQEHFVFAGFVQNMKAFMESIDLFVLPSLWEGFGFVSIEAMACRKPVVCFEVGSNPEIVVNNVTGFLAKPYDVNEMTHFIKRLIEDVSLRNAFGISGRKRVEHVFESASSEKELEDYLHTLTGIRS